VGFSLLTFGNCKPIFNNFFGALPGTLFLFIFLLLQYSILQDSFSLNFIRCVVLPALSKSSALGFLQKFSEVGLTGGRTRDCRTQQSSALSAKPRRTLIKPRRTITKPRRTLN
jgi:hypothetical protein